MTERYNSLPNDVKSRRNDCERNGLVGKSLDTRFYVGLVFWTFAGWALSF